MSPRRRDRKAVIVDEFGGVHQGIQAEAKESKFAAVDQNGDRSVVGSWKVRDGLAGCDIAVLSGAVECLAFVDVDGGNKLVACLSDGSVEAFDTPAEAW